MPIYIFLNNLNWNVGCDGLIAFDDDDDDDNEKSLAKKKSTAKFRTYFTVDIFWNIRCIPQDTMSYSRVKLSFVFSKDSNHSNRAPTFVHARSNCGETWAHHTRRGLQTSHEHAHTRTSVHRHTSGTFFLGQMELVVFVHSLQLNSHFSVWISFGLAFVCLLFLNHF